MKRLCLALLLAGLTLFSLRSVPNGWFQGEDFVHLEGVVQRLQQGPLRALNSGADSGFPHPVTYASWIVNLSLNELEPAGYYWLNLLLHSANVLLVFALCSLLGMRVASSGLATFLFALTSRKLEAVLSISGRGEVLGLFLVLLALVTWAYARKRESRRLRYWSLVPLLLVFGVNEGTALVGGLLLALTDRAIGGRWRWGDLAAPLVLCWLGFLLVLAIPHGSHVLRIDGQALQLYLTGLAAIFLPPGASQIWLLASSLFAVLVYRLALQSGRAGRYGFGWVALALLPPVLMRDRGHALDWGLYPAGVGAGICLAAAFEVVGQWAEARRRRAWLARAGMGLVLLAFGLVQLFLLQRWIQQEVIPRGWQWQTFLAAGTEMPETLGTREEQVAAKRVFAGLGPSPVSRWQGGEGGR